MKVSSQILLAISIVLFLSMADTLTNYRLSLKVEQNTKFLARSESVIRNSNKIHKAIIEMQSAFRGFLLTEDTSFLIPYYAGLSAVPLYTEDQKKLISGSGNQVLLLDSISELHADWVDYTASLINSKKGVNAEMLDSYKTLFENRFKRQVGKKLNDQIAELFTQFDKIEYQSRNIHGSALMSSIDQTHTFSFIFITLTIVIGLSSSIYLVSLISKRIKSMVKLAEDISKGEFTIVNDTSNDELTGLSRSLNIMSEKLNKNIHELENRNQELDKFAYVVSHDLKAPVRGIHNVVKWIEEDLGPELSPEMKKYLSIIPQRTMRMEKLINGLLEYARISEKTQASEVDVNELVNEIVDSIVPRHFKVEIGKLPSLHTEAIKLEQVFTNLISNAVKYIQHDQGRIIISCEEFPDFCRFSVKDNGLGIDSEYHKKIFEIFQTLREKNEIESTGVGLAIVKKIIDEQRSTITVKSTPGEGAEFIFTWQKQINI